MSKPFGLDISTATLDGRHFDKKTRDLIGENLMDIEKTLNALNLDFLQTYQELEKADSAETLFGESYGSGTPYRKSPPASSLMRGSSLESGTKISSVLSEKGGGGSGGSSVTGKSPPTKKQYEMNLFSELNGSGGNVRSPKGIPIRDFKFRQSIDSRCKDRSDYYNLKNEYLSDLTRKQQTQVLSSSPVKKTANSSNQSINQLYQIYNTPMQSRKFDDPSLIVSAVSQNRQRSLSFTENYELKSPASIEAQLLNICQPKQIQQAQSQPKPVPRKVLAYKPKSIRARNLRRLSYNPISMIESSSSSSESELDRNHAQSECDIRSKLSSRRRRQYMQRRSNSNSASSQDKLYGSNASIKSAPQYNYNSDRQYYNYPYNYTDYADNDDDENIYDFGRTPPPPPPPAKYANDPPPTTYSNKTLERDYLFSEFDVSKLTGKSPTTQSYFGAQQGSTNVQTLQKQSSTGSGGLPAQIPASVAAVAQPQPQPGFQWPEKIHGAVVKHNDMLWRQKQLFGGSVGSGLVAPPGTLVGGGGGAGAGGAAKDNRYSSETSSTETDSVDFRREFVPMMPPSPAP